MSRRRTSVGSIFWGLTLVAVGGILLARNLGYSIPIWGALARYWPVLIIAWGLMKLVDYYRFKNDPDRRPLFTGGEVVMLIFVIFAGSAVTTAANITPEFGRFLDFDSDFDFWDITGSTYAYTEHHELDATPGAVIRIYNVYGSVDVKPADGDKIILDVEKSVRAADQAEGDRRAQDFTFSIKNEGDYVYRIVSNRDENVAPGVQIRIGNERQRYKSNLTIRVPRKALLDLTNKYGSVAVEGLEGAQSLNNKYGSTTVHDITGALTLTTGYGTVDLNKISGDTNVTNGYASTTLRTIGGKVTVDNKYGSVDVQDVTGDASIVNRYSLINVQHVGGSVVIKGRNNSVDVEDVGGTLEVETSYKNLSVRNARGEITLKNRHGGVDIELEEAPKHAITVTGEYSDVSLEVPTDAAFGIEAQTRYGEIESDFGFAVSQSGRQRSIRGQQGSDGPRINLQTVHGDIRVEKRG